MSKYSFAPYTKPLGRFKNGKFKFRGKKYYKWFTEPHSLVIQEKAGEYQDIKLTKFEATDNQIKIWLDRKYDFRFNSYTEKGNVKVDRKQLKSLGDYGKDLTKLIKVKKDISQLGGTDNSLIQKFNPKTQAIHGRIDTLGAATHRCLPLNYEIKTIDGYKKWDQLKIGDLVYSSFGKLECLQNINMYEQAKVGTLSNKDWSFICTKNHNWVLPDGRKVRADWIENTKIVLTKEHLDGTEELATNLKFEMLDTPQDVWCPTTETGTWIAKHPDTGQEFITGNSTHSAP